MSIRNEAKVVIIHDDRILLNRCASAGNEKYYVLPGGGQIQYETMEEAIVRECLEETGHSVMPLKFLALYIYEEITEDAELRKRYPDYTHKVYHVFLFKLASEAARTPTERDQNQVNCEWIDIKDIQHIDLRPMPIRINIASILRDGIPSFFGSDHSL